MKILSAISTSLILTAFVLAASIALPVPAQAQQRPARVRAKLDGFDLSAKSGKAPNQIGGASRDIGGTTLLYAPQLGKAYSIHPTFYWSASDQPQKSLFRLMSDKGVTIFESTVTGDHFTYPADAPALTPGSTYRWTIKPENDLVGGAPPPVDFVVIGGSERMALDSAVNAASDSAAKAKVFVDHRVWYDALSNYDDAIQAQPDNKDLVRDRAALYDQLPATQPLADRDMASSH